MKILIGCEFSQVVTKEFRNKGHEAFSCDILPTEGNPKWHYQEDIFQVLKKKKWDMLIAFPPCTYLTYAGTAWWNKPGRLEARLEALNFFAKLWLAPINKICLENPRGCASPTIAKYSQLINPYYFGDSFSKPTCLWLKNLPLLKHTKVTNLFDVKTHVDKGEFVYHKTKSGKIKGDAKWIYQDAIKLNKEERMKFRSKTFHGIAKAMAEQWG